MNDFDPEDLARITEQAEKMLARVEEVKTEIEVVVGRGEAADGQVRVSTGATGRLSEVALAPRAMRLDSQKLAEEVLLAAQRAQDDAERRVKQVMAETLGDDLPSEDHFERLLDSFDTSMDEHLQAIEDRHRSPE